MFHERKNNQLNHFSSISQKTIFRVLQEKSLLIYLLISILAERKQTLLLVLIHSSNTQFL